MSTKPHYGIDAPGLVRSFYFVSFGAWASSLIIYSILPENSWISVIALFLLLAGGYPFFMGCFMVYYSRVTKLHDRDRLLDSLSLKGHEHVLDVGCGRGLMLVGAAKRLNNEGKAFGIDVWNEADQANNKPEAALLNARLEGVSERVEIQTADMREIPFSDQSFDVVLSHWALHNLSNVSDRNRALLEMRRVLKPGGKLLIADIALHKEYAADLTSLGLTEVRLRGVSLKSKFCFAISFGSFCPVAVTALKSQEI